MDACSAFNNKGAKLSEEDIHLEISDRRPNLDDSKKRKSRLNDVIEASKGEQAKFEESAADPQQ